MLGIQTRGRRKVGADKTTEIWRANFFALFLLRSFFGVPTTNAMNGLLEQLKDLTYDVGWGGGAVNEHWRSPTAASVGVEINFFSK